MTLKWILFVAMALACSPVCFADEWKLVWADEFDRDGRPDQTKWGYEEGFVRNEERQYYTLARMENARVEKGVLIIEGRKEKRPLANPNYRFGAPAEDANSSRKEIAYTSACLITKQKESWLYGRIEVRAKVPPGKGMWPGIWMMGIDREHLGWPACGEIDIMEFLGREPDAVHGTVHFRKDGKPAESGKELTGQKPTDGFHVYAIEWSPEQIRFFYDEQVYHTFAVKDAEDKTGNPFHRPQYLLINLALGGSWGGALDDSALPAQFLIDYVRVYRKASALKSAEDLGKNAKADAGKVEQADTTRNAQNVIFNETGVLVNDAGAFPAKRYSSKLKMGKVAWIALQIDNGGKVREDNAAAIEKGWADQWRAAGFKVGFWGCPRGIGKHGEQSAVEQAAVMVKADAVLAVKLASKYHADLYLADCEDSFQSYNPADPAPMLNRVYVDAFKKAAAAAGIADMPRALSSEGRIALDMKPWIDEGWDAMPQAYWNSYAVYQPSRCIDFYVQAGWPIGRIHPTIGTFKGEGENRTVSLQDYARDLKTRGAIGFSFYLPESYLGMDDNAYKQLAEMGAR